MSDSEDSDSFLSAGEGGGDAGNESSDITLSSDSEPEEGGKPTTGQPDSSDITLSSDDDEKDTKPAEKTAANVVAGPEAASEDVRTVGGAAKANFIPDVTDVEVKKFSLKPGQKVNDSSFSMSDVSTALPSSIPINAKGPQTEQSASNKSGIPKAADPFESTELLLKTETARSSQRINASSAPIKQPALQGSQPHSADLTLSAVRTATEAERVHDLHAAPASTHLAASAVAEGWEDLQEDVILPENSAARPDADEEAPDSGRKETEPSSEPAAKSLPQPVVSSEPPKASPEPIPSPSDPSLTSSEPPPSEPAPERRRPERRERRGPLKLGAKKLGSKLPASATEPPSEASEAAATGTAAGSGGPQTAGEGGGGRSHPTAAADVSSRQEPQDGWGGWESWGSSLMSSAAGVTRTVLETMETGLGAPEPEHLARITRQERQKERQEPADATAPAAASEPAPDAGLGLGSWLGGVSRALGQTSSLVVSTGLDTLEAIGKKTMTVLQEDQLGIHGTISQLGAGQRTSLSQALREARQRRGDAVPCPPAASEGTVRQPTFSLLFDQCQGTVHLEALEMLSARCRSRVSAAKGRVDEATGIVLDMVEELCTPDELEEVEVTDFESELSALVARLSVPVKPTRLVIAHSSASRHLSCPTAGPPAEVLGRAVSSAASLGAGLAELLHRLAEGRLAAAGAGADPVSAARHTAALAALVSAQAGLTAARFAQSLSGLPGEAAAAATTDIYLEVSYLQQFCCDSLKLMAPVLQVAALGDRS